eukprot:1941670-Amphidinium_carterae.1
MRTVQLLEGFGQLHRAFVGRLGCNSWYQAWTSPSCKLEQAFDRVTIIELVTITARTIPPHQVLPSRHNINTESGNFVQMSKNIV